MGLQHIIVLQNKIDLIKKDSAKLNYMEIRKFIQGTPAGEKVYTRVIHGVIGFFWLMAQKM